MLSVIKVLVRNRVLQEMLVHAEARACKNIALHEMRVWRMSVRVDFRRDGCGRYWLALTTWKLSSRSADSKSSKNL
jgi:hypothetical protein